MADAIRVGEKLCSLSELETRIREYEIYSNCNYYKRDCRTIDSARKRGIKRFIKPELKFYSINFACIHGGKKHKSRSTGQRPNQSTFRKECPSQIMVVVSENGLSFEVKSIVEEHNHENSQILFQHLPKERRIPNELAKETELLFKLQANKKLMRDHLEAKTGKKIILKDLSNLKSCSKKESLCDDFESLVGKLAGPKEILGWIFSISDIQKAKEGELIGPDLVSSLTADTLSYRLLDDAVDIRTIKRFFSEEGWTSFLAILEEKKSFNEILCTFCNHVKDCNAMGVFCDGCLLWSHLKCVVLKAVPKTKYWFCRSCR